MQVTIKDILTTYWAQTVLLLAALGFLLKRILDLRTKKIDTKQSLFQQNRNVAIMRFMENYVDLQSLYRQSFNQTFDFNKITNEEFLKSLDDKNERLYSAYFYFRLLLDPMEQARYADLINEMRNIANKVIDFSVKYSTGDKEKLISELKVFISNKLEQNNDNFKIIGEILRENASKYYPVQLK